MSKPPSTKSITFPKGFLTASTTCGLKASGHSDLTMIVATSPCVAAGVFTRNRMPGAPVIISKNHLRTGTAQAIICNSGVANVCNGQQGLDDAKAMCQLAAKGLALKTTDVLVCSTGVIGKPLAMKKIAHGLTQLPSALKQGPQADADAARAIMTTDLVPKAANRSALIEGVRIRLGAIAKGSGMIAPNMATMLSFITTDIAITSTLLKKALRQAVATSFNRISVDQDTSTSDSVLVLANGQASNKCIDQTGLAYDTFVSVLTSLCKDLAYKIIQDGEGATRLFRVQITNAKNIRDADRIGKTVVGSPLVKTAIHGGDPNWGRLIMAIGRSGAAIKPDQLQIKIDKIKVCKNGQAASLTSAQAKKLDAIMQQKELTIHIDLGLGEANVQWLGCDLSREYIAINADYTT